MFWKVESQILYMSTLLTQVLSISNAINAMYVQVVDTKHIHTFLPITFLIFNQFSIPKKIGKLRIMVLQPYYQIIYMLTLSTQVFSISNIFNAMNVKAVNAFSIQYTHM